MSSSTPEAAAFALFRQGRLEEAESAASDLLARRPADAQALNLLGCIRAARGHVEEGLAQIDRSIALEPRNAALVNNRARVLADAGRLEEAVADLERAVERDPGFAPAQLHLGALLRRLGRAQEALAALRRAVALVPGEAMAHTTLARLLFETGDFAAAREAFERALALDPGNPGLINNLGLAWHRAGDLDRAVARYAEALARAPGFADALVNWGNALKDRGDLEGALVLHERALGARPELVEAMVNAAGAALDLGRPAQSRSFYERALRVRPDSPDALYGLGQIALREQRFSEGWPGYEWRFATHPPQAMLRVVPLPRLTAESLASVRNVAIWSEQGVGDQLLFATLLAELERRGIEAVVEVDPRLRAAFARSLPRFAFVTPEECAAAFAACDAQLPIGSLGGLFRPDAASFAAQPRALLAPDARRVADYRAQLGPGRWIGISWRSLQRGDRSALGERKSIPLEAFAQLARATGARLVDLQYGDVSEERARFESRHPGMLRRLEGLDAWSDLEGVLAAIAACGRIVTASNATAHFAGAIGQDTTVVCLRGWPPFHYWAAGPVGRSLWYPAVEVAADPSWTTWDEAMARVARSVAMK